MGTASWGASVDAESVARRRHQARFPLDDHHVFEAGRPTAVCRNTARMLSETRLAKYFEVTPERRHLGLFPCGAPGAEPGAARNPEPCC